jgi:hypothetical protein
VKSTIGFLMMVAAGVTLYGHVWHPVSKGTAANRSVDEADATPTPREIIIVPFNGGTVGDRWAHPQH